MLRQRLPACSSTLAALSAAPPPPVSRCSHQRLHVRRQLGRLTTPPSGCWSSRPHPLLLSSPRWHLLALRIPGAHPARAERAGSLFRAPLSSVAPWRSLQAQQGRQPTSSSPGTERRKASLLLRAPCKEADRQPPIGPAALRGCWLAPRSPRGFCFLLEFSRLL